ncbi:MAG: ribonuclease III [Bacteroidaceae bacterium]|nr:ribonuclease III [Bacteroidaceae bacterium]
MDFQDFITWIKLPVCKDRELYRSFHQILGFYPRDIYPYKVAVMHKSMGFKEEGKRINNERLEFLGDAILGAVVGHIVFKQFPKKSEGFLTNTRSNIVKRQSLNKIAREIGFDKLILSNYKQQTHNSYVNGNAFEALVGAIYLDRGYGHCVRFVRKLVMSHLVNIEKAAYGEVNHKSKLIEWGQKHHIEIEFLAEQSTGNEASPIFHSYAKISGITCGEGQGYSKKESQQSAAQEALNRLSTDITFRDSLLKANMGDNNDMEEPIAESNHEEESEKELDFDLSDISMKEKNREQIIAEAEAQAFAGGSSQES